MVLKEELGSCAIHCVTQIALFIHLLDILLAHRWVSTQDGSIRHDMFSNRVLILMISATQASDRGKLHRVTHLISLLGSGGHVAEEVLIATLLRSTVL